MDLRRKGYTQLVLIAVLVTLSGCNGNLTIAPSVTALCDAEAARSLVGKPKPEDEAAMQRTGAKTVRQIQPGDMVTQDFREDRVTIETDPASGRVTRATCG